MSFTAGASDEPNCGLLTSYNQPTCGCALVLLPRRPPRPRTCLRPLEDDRPAMRNTMSLAPRHDIYGMAIQAVTRDDLEKTVIGELERDAGGWLLPANLEVMRQFRSEHELRRLLSHAD